MPNVIMDRRSATARYYPVIFVLVGVVWSALTLGFDCTIARTTWLQFQATGFATAAGVITDSEVEKQDDGDGMTYRPNVAYRYRVAGVEYHGTEHSYDQVWWSGGGAQRIVGENPVGKSVVVHYDPNNPSDAVLHAGLDGSDLLKIMFVVPFNIIMVGFWGAAGGAIYRRTARPPAGGAKTWNDGGRVHVRLPKFDPLSAAAAAAIGVDVVGMFILGGFDITPTLSSVLMLVGAILVGGAGAYLYQEGKLAQCHSDLVIDDSAQTISLPRTMGRRSEAVVPIQYIASVELEQIEEKDWEGQRSYRFAPTLVLTDGAGSMRYEKLVEWWDQSAAKELVVWLRARLRIEPKRDFA